MIFSEILIKRLYEHELLREKYHFVVDRIDERDNAPVEQSASLCPALGGGGNPNNP